jgi:hypothetical protein
MESPEAAESTEASTTRATPAMAASPLGQYDHGTRSCLKTIARSAVHGGMAAARSEAFDTDPAERAAATSDWLAV